VNQFGNKKWTHIAETMNEHLNVKYMNAKVCRER